MDGIEPIELVLPDPDPHCAKCEGSGFKREELRDQYGFTVAVIEFTCECRYTKALKRSDPRRN